MEKVDFNPDVYEPATEHTDSAPKPVRRSVTPLVPMTDEEYEALCEIMKMMGIKDEDLSEERYQELHKLWT